MGQRPLISVVIPTFNAARYVSRCLEHVFQQDAEGVEVIVVDDGSTDNTTDAIAGYGDRIRLIPLGSNLGPSAARNIGLHHARGEFIAFLDADDYWLPKCLRIMSGALMDNPACVAAVCRTVVKRWDGLVKTTGLEAEYTRQVAGSPQTHVIDRPFDCFCCTRIACVGSVMARKAALQEIGGFDESLRVTEDVELWACLASVGEWVYVDQALFVTDQEVTTPKGRYAKTTSRYLSFKDQDVNEWFLRIDALGPRGDGTAYRRLKGDIVSLVATAKAYAGQYHDAYSLCSAHRDLLAPGVCGILKCGLRFPPSLWPSFCHIVHLREMVKCYCPHAYTLVRNGVRRLARARHS
jgi:glycosyltransferase involved in cell wall biosynthesis